MKKINLKKISLLILLSIHSICFANQLVAPQLNNSFEGAKLYQINHINILQLHGSYEEMGRQYGALMKTQINQFYHGYIEKTLLKNPQNYQKIQQIFGNNAWQSYPRRIQQLMMGMSETSGLSAHQLMLIDQNFMLTFITSKIGMCSTLAAWGPYTKNGEMIIGHNLDWMPAFQQQYSDLLTVIIFNPTDGSNSAAAINYAGGLYPISGLNDHGLYINVHDGSDSMGTVFYKNRMMYIGAMLSFLWDSNTLDTLNKEILSTGANFPMLITAANKQAAYIYETAPQAIAQRKAQVKGMIAATNHFVSSQWGVMNFSSDDYTLVRYQHLINLAKQYRGTIDIDTMQAIMAKPLFSADGKIADGVTEYQIHPGLPTITAYQIITEPAEQKIWLRVPNHGDWTEIDLKDFFIANTELHSATNCETLDCVRNNIDAIDTQLVSLLGLRLSYVADAGKIKNNSAAIHDQTRENQVLSSVQTQAQAAGYPDNIIVTIFQTILAQSNQYEKQSIVINKASSPQ